MCVCVGGGGVEETEKRFCIMVRKDLLQKHSDVSPSLIWKTVKIPILDTAHTHTHAHISHVTVVLCCADRIAESAICINTVKTIVNSH